MIIFSSIFLWLVGSSRALKLRILYTYFLYELDVDLFRQNEVQDVPNNVREIDGWNSLRLYLIIFFFLSRCVLSCGRELSMAWDGTKKNNQIGIKESLKITCSHDVGKKRMEKEWRVSVSRHNLVCVLRELDYPIVQEIRSCSSRGITRRAMWWISSCSPSPELSTISSDFLVYA